MHIRQMFSNMPIARKILASMFLVSLFLLSVVIVVTSHLSSSVIIDQAKQASSQSLHDVAEKLDMTFKEIETYTKMAIANAALQDEFIASYSETEPVSYFDRNHTIVRLLETFIKPRTKIEAMSLLNFVNNSVYSSNGQSAFNELYPENITVIRDSLSPGNILMWGDPREQALKWIVPLYMKIYNGYSGAPLGLIETDIPLSLFSDILSQHTADGNDLYILDKTGRILATHTASRVRGPLSEQQIHFCLQSINSPKIYNSSLYETKTYDASGWLLASIVSLEEISAATRPLMIQFLILGILSLFISLFISYLVSNSITKPLRVMEHSMRILAHPVVPQHVPVHGSNEVGRLAQVYNEMVDRIAISIEQNNAEQKKIRQYEISLLQAQTNPHFLNNIMENISGLIELNRQEESLSLIRDAAAFYRSVLSGGKLMVSIERELEIARLFLKIQNVRHDNRIIYHFDVEESIKQSPIVKLTIQPLLENAILHGFEGRTGKWEITIKGRQKGATVVLQIRDNGKGMDAQKVLMVLEKDNQPKKTVQKKSVGVYATHKRLVLAFGEMYGLSYQSEEGVGTCVKILLPKEMPNEQQ